MIAETGSGEHGAEPRWVRSFLRRTLPRMPRVRAALLLGRCRPPRRPQGEQHSGLAAFPSLGGPGGQIPIEPPKPFAGRDPSRVHEAGIVVKPLRRRGLLAVAAMVFAVLAPGAAGAAPIATGAFIPDSYKDPGRIDSYGRLVGASR